MSARDKKVLAAIVPLVFVLGFWFLVMSPKRQEAAQAGERLAKAERSRDKAEATLASLEQSRKSFDTDYVELVRIGKAIPTQLDMAGIVVQLQRAAKGTKIRFSSIKVAEASDTSATPAAATPPAAPGGKSDAPAAPGGAPAQSTPGKQAEGAGNGVNTANKDAAANTPPANGKPGAAAPAAPAAAGGCAAGLECVPLELEFDGRFFSLADLFHELKRFVKVANNRLEVRGRLVTIESLKFTSDKFPMLKVQLKATAYLSPPEEGATAGASPTGPPAATPAAAPAPGAAPAAPTPPAATATP